MQNIDWQGHRGCRGLMPENTIPAFTKALDYPIQTLELDVVVSKDKKIIVSHEPWMGDHICSHPDGRAVTKEEAEQLLIYEMTYEEIKQYDCGKRGNEKYPEQIPTSTYKPSFKDMVKTVDQYCRDNNIPLPNYDIEIKSYKNWYNTKQPLPAEFVQLMLAEIEDLGIKDRLNLQSFDIEVLKEIKKQDASIVVAYLIEGLPQFKKNMAKLDYTPEIFSPYFKVITPGLVRKVHAKGMKLIPWTVNEIEDMKKMIALGVDGIITDYPNRINEAIELAKKEL